MNEALCGLLKQARLRRGLTQDAAGQMIYLSGNGYGKVERGLRDLTTEQLLALCRGLGISVSEMLSSFGDSRVHPSMRHEYEGGCDMNNNNEPVEKTGLTAMGGAKAFMVSALAAHTDYVCLAAGMPYRNDVQPIENLARLFVDMTMDGDRPVKNPVRALADAIDNYSTLYAISCDVQDEAAEIAIELSAYWDGRHEMPLRQVVHNILWHTDFGAIAACPAYANRIGALGQRFHADMNATLAARQHEEARRARVSSALRPGMVVELHGSRDPDRHEYALLTECSNRGRHAGSCYIVMLHAGDEHTVLNTMCEAPYIEVHTNSGLCPDTLWANTHLSYSLTPERIYDVVGEIDKPALEAVLSAVDKGLGTNKASRNDVFYGACVRYRYEGSVRHGIVMYADDGHEKVRLFDVFFLTESEAASDPAYIKLSRDTSDPDGELFYDFDFPDNVYPYLKRGSITSFDRFHEDAVDVCRIGSWPNKAYANDRIRDLGVLLDDTGE